MNIKYINLNQNKVNNGKEPITAIVNQSGYAHSMGLTKREHFAALAMTKIEPPIDFYKENETIDSYQLWAAKCVKMADELLKELDKSI